jgi:putative ABC transport system permease protein
MAFQRILRGYVSKSATRRLSGTALVVLGMALVAYVFVLVSAFAAGIERVFELGAASDRLLVLRPGATTDVQSFVERDELQRLLALPEVADGSVRASPELVLLVSRPRRDGRRANLLVRGVQPEAFGPMEQVRLVDGRRIAPGADEAMVARRVQERFSGFELGEVFRAGSLRFQVVGFYDAADTPFDSEIWVDLERAQAQSDRRGIVSAVRLEGRPGALGAVERSVRAERGIGLEVRSEADYYAEQVVTAAPVRVLAWIVAILLATGAAFGAMNAMYGQVAARSRELATLRALGFARRHVLCGLLIESVLLGAFGALLGCALARLTVATLLVEGTGTQNLLTFAEVVVGFHVSPALVATAVGLGAAVGLVGGLHPALRAATMDVGTALRGR